MLHHKGDVFAALTNKFLIVIKDKLYILGLKVLVALVGVIGGARDLVKPIKTVFTLYELLVNF